MKTKLSNDVLLEKINNNEVIEEIDENNQLIKVFRDKQNNSITGFGCNWNKCRFINLNRDEMVSHINSRHKPYKCWDNDKYFKSLNQTTNKSIKSESLKCLICGLQCRDSDHFNSHRKTHISNLRKCEVTECDFETFDFSQYLTHKKSHMKFKCDFTDCEFKTNNSFALRGHKRSHTPFWIRHHLHLSSLVKSDKSEQQSMANISNSNNNKVNKALDIDLIENDMNNNIDYEVIADQRNSRALELLLEKVNTKEVVIGVDESNQLIKVFLNKQNNSIIGFGCNWNKCQFINLTKDLVITHINLNHKYEYRCKEQRLKCLICGFQCRDSNQYFEHKRSHTSNLIFKCNFKDCKFETRDRNAIRDHMSSSHTVKHAK